MLLLLLLLLSRAGLGWSSASRTASEPAPGNKEERSGDDDTSITPRWISSDGRTLSVNTGELVVEGIGNGRGEMDPKRMDMAWIRKSAFLKQYIADVALCEYDIRKEGRKTCVFL